MAITEAKTDAEKTEMASKDFLGLLGCVSYITLKTRPDCQFHVSRIGQGDSDRVLVCDSDDSVKRNMGV